MRAGRWSALTLDFTRLGRPEGTCRIVRISRVEISPTLRKWSTPSVSCSAESLSPAFLSSPDRTATLFSPPYCPKSPQFWSQGQSQKQKPVYLSAVWPNPSRPTWPMLVSKNRAARFPWWLAAGRVSWRGGGSRSCWAVGGSDRAVRCGWCWRGDWRASPHGGLILRSSYEVIDCPDYSYNIKDQYLTCRGYSWP